MSPAAARCFCLLRAAPALHPGPRALVDDVQAAVWYRRSAAGNVATAQFSLGCMHMEGRGGLEKSDDKAVALYRLASAAGERNALYNLGNCFRDGIGVPKDLSEAVRLWGLAADKGQVLAKAALACAYMYAEGVEKDYDAALRFARSAADSGSFLGERQMGVLCFEGWGVARDAREAARWWAKAAARGDASSIECLRMLAAQSVPEAAAALRRLGLS